MNAGDLAKSASTKLTTPECIRSLTCKFAARPGHEVLPISFLRLEIVSQAATDAISHGVSVITPLCGHPRLVHAWQAQATHRRAATGPGMP